MNLKTVLLIIVFAVLGVAICYYVGSLGENLFTPVHTTISGWLGGFNIQEAASNPATLIAGVGTAVTIAVPLISKLNSTKQQAAAVVQNAQTQIGYLTNEATDAKNQLESANLSMAEAEKKLKSLQAIADTAGTKISGLEKQNQSLLTQLDALNNIQARANVLADNKEVVRTLIK